MKIVFHLRALQPCKHCGGCLQVDPQDYYVPGKGKANDVVCILCNRVAGTIYQWTGFEEETARLIEAARVEPQRGPGRPRTRR